MTKTEKRTILDRISREVMMEVFYHNREEWGREQKAHDTAFQLLLLCKDLGLVVTVEDIVKPHHTKDRHEKMLERYVQTLETIYHDD